MKRAGSVSKRIITDKLRSYGAAKRELLPGLDHWSHKGLNNRAENSHLPFRKRERVMQGHRSPGGLQLFVSIHSATRNCFSVPAHRRAALTIRYHRIEAFRAWKIAASVGHVPDQDDLLRRRPGHNLMQVIGFQYGFAVFEVPCDELFLMLSGWHHPGSLRTTVNRL